MEKSGTQMQHFWSNWKCRICSQCASTDSPLRTATG